MAIIARQSFITSLLIGGFSLWICLACAPPKRSRPITACADGNPVRERHGTDCLCCHAEEFGVAGSIDLAGPKITMVIVEDSAGQRAEMAPNPYGNYFRHLQLVPPLRAMVLGSSGKTSSMQEPIETGSCNSCHGQGGLPQVRGPD